MASNRQLIVEIVGDDRKLSRTYQNSAADAKKFDRTLSQTIRGAAAGSGAFRSLGRSIAFASAGFLGVATITDVLRGSIVQASEAAATQKQLSAQFKASGLNLRDYQKQIDETSLRLSQLAGIEDDELKQAFTTAFRGSQNVSAAFAIQAAAADVARGRHINLATATIALTKAYGGQTTALRRLGVQVPATLHGLAAIQFVQARFAGQARAGTTAQERFSAAFKNFEEILGTALLPTFNKILTSLSRYLNNTENQKKIQHDATTAAHGLGTALVGVGKAFDFITSKKGQIVTGFALTKAAFNTVKTAVHAVNVELSSYQGNLLKIGAGDRQMRGAQAMAIQNALTATPGVTQPTRTSRTLGLHGQFLRSQLDLARAQVTAGLADDRQVLAEQEHIVKSALSQTTNLKKRTKLYQQLGSIEEQIRSIDAKYVADRKANREKELEQRQKDLADYARLQERGRQLLAQFRENVRKQREALQAAVQNVRGELGTLLSGPVLNPAESATKGILGVTGGGGPTGASINRDIKAQTQQAVRFFNDLARIRKRGASAQTVSELRALGLGSADLIHTIAAEKRADFSTFLKVTAQREKVVQQIAHADVTARNATVVIQNARFSRATPSSQRRGRQAGVPSSIGSYIGG